MLRNPEPSKPFIVDKDVTDVSFGGVLPQATEAGEQVVAFYS